MRCLLQNNTTVHMSFCSTRKITCMAPVQLYLRLLDDVAIVFLILLCLQFILKSLTSHYTSLHRPNTAEHRSHAVIYIEVTDFSLQLFTSSEHCRALFIRCYLYFIVNSSQTRLSFDG